MALVLQPRRFDSRKFAWVLVVIVGYVLYTTHRDSPPRLWGWSGPAFGSTYSVKVVTPDLDAAAFEKLQAEVESCLDSINQHMSTWLTNSALSLFNASASTEPFTVPADLAEVTQAALQLSRISGGAFDCTYAPMFELWGFGKDGPRRVPSESEIESTRSICGYGHLSVPAAHQLQKDIPRLEFNLNAIAPGYAADRIAVLLRARGFTNMYVDVGGEVIAFGASPRGDKWRVGLERPEYDAPVGQEPYKVIPLSGWALATSGDYRLYGRDENGRVFSHIFDTRLGRPATSHVASVSVLATNCMMADALATTLFVMGPEEGLNWLSNVPPAEALFVMRGETGGFYEVRSPGFPPL